MNRLTLPLDRKTRPECIAIRDFCHEEGFLLQNTNDMIDRSIRLADIPFWKNIEEFPDKIHLSEQIALNVQANGYDWDVPAGNCLWTVQQEFFHKGKVIELSDYAKSLSVRDLYHTLDSNEAKSLRSTRETAVLTRDGIGQGSIQGTLHFYYQQSLGHDTELTDFQREITARNKAELLEKAKRVKLPSSADYACVQEEYQDAPTLKIMNDGIQDLEENRWISYDSQAPAGKEFIAGARERSKPSKKEQRTAAQYACKKFLSQMARRGLDEKEVIQAMKDVIKDQKKESSTSR